MNRVYTNYKTVVEYCGRPRQRVINLIDLFSVDNLQLPDFEPLMHPGRSQAIGLEEVSRCTFIVPACLCQAGSQATQGLARPGVALRISLSTKKIHVTSKHF